ncbi:MAG TPA: hypothetical protein P5210_09155 [Draconibacterium sp.]|nr:hypothetical protein [Draconibacterium sp.]HRX11804.1 hypothetical protein [Draconibacterium sp.]
MGKFSNLKIVLLILLVVLILVLVKTLGKNGFKQDAKIAVETVSSNNFLVLPNDLKNKEKQYLIVSLDESSSQQFENSVNIPFEKLLDDKNLQKLKETESNILLVSADNSISAKAWVILNQLKIRNVYILSTEENPEVLKYEFQPDTLTGIENIN